MAEMERPSTPPRRSAAAGSAKSPITPEQVRRMEESRLRAKAARQQQDAALQASQPTYPTSNTASLKRSHSAMSTAQPVRSARDAPTSVRNAAQKVDDDTVPRAARKFQKYVEYDFSQMTDTKGGFMTADDDPHNRVLHSEQEQKPANMSLKEWETLQLQRKLRKQKTGLYEPGLSVLNNDDQRKICRECGTLEIDFQWDEALKTQVCHACKDKHPEKYSLLTKTEAREDYLLTDPELKDTTLLPHLKKPNPHNARYNDMMLYLRYQVEEYAFSDAKWGSAEALDAEFEKRKQISSERRDKKFQKGLKELKKRTRVEAYKRARAGGGGGFGDTIGKGKHEHEWGEAVEDPESGATKRRCVDCGMEVEELEF